MKKLYARSISIIGNNCGVGQASVFREQNDPGYGAHFSINEFDNPGGAGWLLASFTPETTYRKAYKALVARFGPPIFQSPVRTNNRTGNKFFMCIFDTKGK